MLLPADLMGQLNDSEQMVLVLHELVHLKRRDHLVRILELIVSVACWWLPVVRLIGAQLRACEEACCDAAVVSRQPQARRDYARLLLDVLDFLAPLPRTVEHATAMNSASDLEQRLRAILETSLEKPPRWRRLGIVGVVLACGILPCGLRYDLVGKLASAAMSAKPEPGIGPTRPTETDRIGVRGLELCCPS
jgi:beta-lactamase regulating signal transducer with metallopeptidase domain